MKQTLVLVEKTDGKKKNYSLNLDATLEYIRQKLTEDSFMSKKDEFFVQNTPIKVTDESTVVLKQLVNEDGSKSLQIGQKRVRDPRTIS